MSRLKIFLSRLRGLFLKRNLEQELADEIQSHLEMQIEDYERQGMNPEQARYAALRKFGGVDQVKERYRDRRGLPFVETFLRDLGYGARLLRRSPIVTIVAILSLALGIGANTALFSVVDAVLLKTLPVEAPDRLLVFEWQAGRAFRTTGMSGTSNVNVPPNMRGLSLFRYEIVERMQQAQLAAGSESPLSDLFAFGPISKLTAKVGDEAEIIKGQAVSGNYFAALKVQPELGRAITPDDDRSGATPVVMLSNQFWQERFAANPAVIGQQVTLNKQSFTIVGVTPPEFNGTLQVNYKPAVTVPLALEPLMFAENSYLESGIWWLNVMGRLKPGATDEQAREGLNGAFQSAALELMPTPKKANQLAAAQLDPKDYPQLLSESGRRGMPDVRKRFAPSIYVLSIVVTLVLLIACANVANLLLARVALRGPEISIRLAVGAGRWCLIRQLLTESLLLAALGGVVGVLFAFWGKSMLLALTKEETGLFPSGVDLSINWRVLVFTLVISLLTGLLFGSIPAWRATRLHFAATLNHSRGMSSAVSRLSKGLLVLQLAVSFLLLMGAGLFIRTLYNLERVNVGFNQENLLVFTLQPEDSGYKDERLLEFYQQLFSRLDHLPSVRAVTFGRIPLIANSNWYNDFLLPGESESTAPERDTMRQVVRENYFATMEIPFLNGREFTPRDDRHAPRVGIVNQTFVRKFFPDRDVLGKSVRFPGDKHEIEIVGIVADTKYESQREDVKPLLYTAWQQEVAELGEMHFVMRTVSEPTSLAASVRQVVSELDSNLPIMEIGTQSARAQSILAQERLYVRLLGFFGGVALLLAAIGLFGVMAYSVSQRTKEIGIRMAFGAPMASVLRLVIWQGMKLVLFGLTVGALAWYALNRLLQSQYFGPETWQRGMTQQLYGIKLSDPLTLIVTGSLLILVALIACWLPARRAAKVDPWVALRYE
ncbi:MAG TPA: ABC transporter permease [Pyrinomonadaceae bacterium]